MVVDRLKRRHRLALGGVFLLIAVAVLAVQPFNELVVLVTVAGAALLISTGLFATLGAEQVDTAWSFDVGNWAVSVAFATAMYAAVAIVISGDLHTLAFVTFVLGYGTGLAMFNAVRARVRNR